MVRITRRQDWPQRMLEAIAEKEDMRFQPGVHDCCISACDIVLNMTGTDVAVKVRGYSGKEEMQDVLDIHGGVEGTVENAMKENSCGEIPVSMASRGDFLLLDMPETVLAVVGTDGMNAVVCGLPKGWKHASIKRYARRAWRVG